MKEVISFLKKLAENDDLRKRDDLRDFYGTLYIAESAQVYSAFSPTPISLTPRFCRNREE